MSVWSPHSTHRCWCGRCKLCDPQQAARILGRSSYRFRHYGVYPGLTERLRPQVLPSLIMIYDVTHMALRLFAFSLLAILMTFNGVNLNISAFFSLC